MAKTRLTFAAAVVGLIATGCGGSSQPHLARADVAPLIALADQIAREPGCAQKRDLAALQTQAIALIKRRAVPSQLQETFLSGVNDLAGRAPACTPPPNPPPPGKGHGHGKGHDKHDQGDEG